MPTQPEGVGSVFFFSFALFVSFALARVMGACCFAFVAFCREEERAEIRSTICIDVTPNADDFLNLNWDKLLE